ncbi:c-type cytochrome [Wielerella bovis]|uniref:c-type cytochrome n=1 Tax=Wielerella bovis TaxID=2917790 RepID=UPI0020193DBD|nr:cytochrome c [Wielerella bovis]ULJ64616.1 cytochrome c [Wielerella bovis]ULJ66888.1 cytochrome c [Wielerella bovis]ULJ69106.1 cytochrome c [Wielerella bovis]
MKYTAILFTALFLVACGGQSGANGQVGGKGDISQNRTTAFKSFMPTFSSMGKVVKGEDAYEVEKFKTLASSFQDEARAPFDYFQNDPKGNGDALPAIWEKPDEFKAEQDKFLAAVDKLNAAAQSGDLAQIKAAYGEAGASCKSCHDAYRAPK